MCPAGEGGAPSEQLRALREAAGLTQAEAAKRLGMDVGTLSRKERGQSAVGRVDLLAAESAFGLGVPRDTLGDKPPPAGVAAGAGEDVRSADYWRGRQDALLEIMEHVGELHAKAIRAQREIIANTVPTPRVVPPAQPADATPAPRPQVGAAKRRRVNG